MYQRSKQSLILVFLVAFLAGCSILTGSQVPPTIAPPQRPVTTVVAIEANQTNFNSPFQQVVQPSRDPDILNLVNNISVPTLQGYVQELQNFGTRSSFSETQREDFGIGAARRWIKAEFERVGQGKIITEFQDFPLIYPNEPTANQRNVIAILPGTGNYSGRVIIGAHYDSRLVDEADGTSITPAANDNASGVAMLLELARLMSARSWNQTIVFVAFSSEEQGTKGSQHFVNQLFLSNQSADFFLNNDSIGGELGIPQSIRLFSPQMDTSIHGQVARYSEYLNRMYQPEFPVTIVNRADRDGRYGDHREFQDANIRAVRFTQSVENPDLLNCSCDTWEKIDYEYLRKALTVNLVTIANWAGAPPPPQVPVVAPMDQEGSYIVNWPVDPQAASYAVSFRPMTTAEYPQFRLVSGAEAGQLVIDGLDPQITYGVSIAAISPSGRLGGFSPERIYP